MSTPNHQATVEDVRRAYGPTMTRDQCVALCNAVAWRHKGEGFGVAEKTSGTRGTRRDGRQCAIDGLVYRPPGGGVDQFVDILINADGTTPPKPNGDLTSAVPSWQDKGDSGRPWVAPIDPDPTGGGGGGGEPPAGDYVTRAEFTVYKAKTDQAVADLTADVGELRLRLDDAEARIAALEKAPPGTPPEYQLVPDPSAPPVSTSRNGFPGHSHDLRAKAVPKP